MKFHPLVLLPAVGLALFLSWAPGAGAEAVGPVTPDSPESLGGSTPYVGEIRWVGFNFAPRGFAFCEGQLLSVSSYPALFSLLGTIYGGDGRTTFGLPDLRGRFPMHAGLGPGLSNRALGATGGQAGVTLTAAQMPSHNHLVPAVDGLANDNNPEGNVFAKHANGQDLYAPGLPDLNMDAKMVANAGGGQAHENRHPYLGLRAVIALDGIYPSRTVGPTAGGDAYIGEIRWFPYNFAPRGFAYCDGQLLDVSSNQALFSLVGTIYGGDGRTNFALPDLRGRVPVHQGQGSGLSNRPLGQRGGSEAVTLTENQLPSHSHKLRAIDVKGNSMSPVDKFPGTGKAYHVGPPTHALASEALAETGGGEAHDNMAPYQAIHACIALTGVFPSRNTRGSGGTGFIGEVRWVAFSFAPRGWAYCDGQILPISSWTALFSLLGTMYGGDGRTSFGLPDLRGRTPLHSDATIRVGQRGGSESVPLSLTEMPSHSHQARGTSTLVMTDLPDGDLLATAVGINPYLDSVANVPPLVATAPSLPTGGGQAHENMQPYTVIGACIILEGIYPSRN